jgi:hypothetical protein
MISLRSTTNKIISQAKDAEEEWKYALEVEDHKADVNIDDEQDEDDREQDSDDDGNEYFEIDSEETDHRTEREDEEDEIMNVLFCL